MLVGATGWRRQPVVGVAQAQLTVGSIAARPQLSVHSHGNNMAPLPNGTRHDLAALTHLCRQQHRDQPVLLVGGGGRAFYYTYGKRELYWY